MKLITQRDLIRNVAKKWRQQYEPFKHDSPLFSERHGYSKSLTKQEIAEALDKLDGDTATAADVANIIGNSSWTRIQCDECKSNEVDAVLRVGDEPDYESHTACLCRKCVRNAAATIWPTQTSTAATSDPAPSPE